MAKQERVPYAEHSKKCGKMIKYLETHISYPIHATQTLPHRDRHIAAPRARLHSPHPRAVYERIVPDTRYTTMDRLRPPDDIRFRDRCDRDTHDAKRTPHETTHVSHHPGRLPGGSLDQRYARATCGDPI